LAEIDDPCEPVVLHDGAGAGHFVIRLKFGKKHQGDFGQAEIVHGNRERTAARDGIAGFLDSVAPSLADEDGGVVEITRAGVVLIADAVEHAEFDAFLCGEILKVGDEFVGADAGLRENGGKVAFGSIGVLRCGASVREDGGKKEDANSCGSANHGK